MSNETSENVLLKAALSYAARGWHIIPLHSARNGHCSCGKPDCSSPGKHPRTSHGLKDASVDAGLIEEWWGRWPDANIGVLTGATSGLIVIDVDPRNGGEYALEWLLGQHGPLPETVESLTGGGGRHLFLRHPGGHVTSRAGALGFGLDVKADGGYVVAPPSFHNSGRRYEWESSSAPDQVEVAELPTWLWALLRCKPAARDCARPSSDQSPDRIPEGKRNVALTRLAGSMRRAGMSADEMLPTLLEVNVTRCDPALPEEEIRRIAASVAKYPPADGQPVPPSADGGQDGHNTDALVDLILGSSTQLFHDQRDAAYARVPTPDGHRIMSIDSGRFEKHIVRSAYRTMHWSPGREVLGSTKRLLTSIACLDCNKYALSVRVARKEGAIWLDLDGVRAARVGPDGWQVVSDPPILFRSFAHQRPLPEPVSEGDVREVLRFVNVADPDARLLFLCYLVVGLVPAVPVPALVVYGPQGAAKTTLLRVAKRVLDPSAVEVCGGSSSASEYALAASQSRLLVFDNMTRTPAWLSDAICRTVTGDGWAKRRLYSDDDLMVVDYRGLVGLAGINVPANRADLLDRAIILELEHISTSDRRDETSFWDEFDLARPRILGAALDALSAAMRIIPEVVLSSMPRMADFARWGTAAAMAMGFSAAEFEMAYARNVGRQNQAALEANPAADAVLVLMADRAEWTGTPTDLFDILTETARRAGIDVRVSRWPKAASALKKHLREAETNLLAEGIMIVHDRSAHHRSVSIHKVGSPRVGAAEIVETTASETSATAPSHDRDHNDDGDGSRWTSAPTGGVA